MGTRGAYGVRIDDHDKLGYNHDDSYPAKLGAELADEVTTLLARHGLEGLRTLARALRSSDREIRTPRGRLGPRLEAGTIDDANDFPRDGLYCEWAVVVNLDDARF